MTRVMPSPQAVNDAYMAIRARRPNWFRVCPLIEPDDLEGFESWIMGSVAWWYVAPTEIVFVERRGHVAQFHVAFIGPVDEDFLRKAVEAEEADGAIRCEVPLVGTSSHVIRRILRNLDFLEEGTLRASVAMFDARERRDVYLDVEMWARLSKGRP